MEFQALSWHAGDVELDADETKYIINVFGRTLQGESVSVSINNFKPFF